MKIPLGGGAYLEPDEEPRNSQFHRRIVKIAPIAHTRSGRVCALDCGHVVYTFGDVAKAGGVALCTECRDESALWKT